MKKHFFFFSPNKKTIEIENFSPSSIENNLENVEPNKKLPIDQREKFSYVLWIQNSIKNFELEL